MGSPSSELHYTRTPAPTTMLLLTLLATSASASVLPLTFSFGSRNPSLRMVKQCEGHDDDALVLVEGTTPDEICMPGTTVINMHTIIREDLPTDLTLNLDLHKITPFPMTVPCLNGVGSCEYELCPMIEDMADTWRELRCLYKTWDRSLAR